MGVDWVRVRSALALVAALVGGCVASNKPRVVAETLEAGPALVQAHTTLKEYVLERIANVGAMEDCMRVDSTQPRTYPGVYTRQPVKMMTLTCRVPATNVYARFDMEVGVFSSRHHDLVFALCKRGYSYSCKETLVKLLDRAEEQMALLTHDPNALPLNFDEPEPGESMRAAALEEQAIRSCASSPSDDARQACEDSYQVRAGSPRYAERKVAILNYRLRTAKLRGMAPWVVELISALDEQRMWCAGHRPLSTLEDCSWYAWTFEHETRRECRKTYGRNRAMAARCIRDKTAQHERILARQRAEAAAGARYRAAEARASRQRRSAAISAGIRGVGQTATREIAQTNAEIARQNVEVHRILDQQRRQREEYERQKRADRQRRSAANRRMAEAQQRRQMEEQRRQQLARHGDDQMRAPSRSSESPGRGAGRGGSPNAGRAGARDGAASSPPQESAAFRHFCKVANQEYGGKRVPPVELFSVERLAGLLTDLAKVPHPDRVTLPPKARELYEQARSLAESTEPDLKRAIASEKRRVRALPRPDSRLQEEFKRGHEDNINAPGLGYVYILSAPYRKAWLTMEGEGFMKNARALRKLADALRQLHGKSYYESYVRECQ